MVRATYVYDIYCLGHWNEKMKERTKKSNLIAYHFYLILANLSLVSILYLHVWLQNKRKFLVWREYDNRFGIHQPSCVSTRPVNEWHAIALPRPHTC